jgi:hypothetical protein
MEACTSLILLLLLAASSPVPSPPAVAPSPAAAADAPLILFLVDNSASLPPLDPEEKRVVALEKMFGFLRGEKYRLILFGGRNEVFVDDVSRYRNNGQWTDFFFAFAKAREITREYPEKTPFRMILLTDAIVDPDPRDWPDVPPGEGLKAYSVRRTIELIGEMKIPLYVILVGDPPKEGVVPGDREQSPGLVLDMVRAANGALADPTAQSLASFFGDDGVLLKKFIFRVAPHEGLKKVEPIVKRIVAPPRPGVELRFFFLAIFPLLAFLVLLLGALVRSFPGPGDLEVIELSLGAPVHLGVDRLHRTEGGNWATTGLCLVGDAREASATLTYQTAHVDLAGGGLDDSGLDPLSRQLLPLDLDELRRVLERYSDEGTKEEKIFALNLDYMAKNMNASEAERIVGTHPSGRSRMAAADFLRAKVHLVGNDALRRKLTEPRVQLVTYGRDAQRKDLAPGALCRIGRYGFLVKDVTRGGRRDARLVLYYDRVPSLLALKTILPDAFQRLFRMRRSSHRVVT